LGKQLNSFDEFTFDQPQNKLFLFGCIIFKLLAIMAVALLVLAGLTVILSENGENYIFSEHLIPDCCQFEHVQNG